MNRVREGRPDLFDIFINENPDGIIASFSGQTGIGVREHIEKTFRADFMLSDPRFTVQE